MKYCVLPLFIFSCCTYRSVSSMVQYQVQCCDHIFSYLFSKCNYFGYFVSCVLFSLSLSNIYVWYSIIITYLVITLGMALPSIISLLCLCTFSSVSDKVIWDYRGKYKQMYNAVLEFMFYFSFIFVFYSNLLVSYNIECSNSCSNNGVIYVYTFLELFLAFMFCLLLSRFYSSWLIHWAYCHNRSEEFVPSSGDEKAYRTSLFNMKKRNKKKFSKNPVKNSSFQKGGICQIPRVAKFADLDRIYKNVPSFEVLKPSAEEVPIYKSRLLRYFGVKTADDKNIEKTISFLESISLLIVSLLQASTHRHRASILVMWAHARFAKDKSILLNLTDVILYCTKLDVEGLTSVMGDMSRVWKGEEKIGNVFIDEMEQSRETFEPSAGEEKKIPKFEAGNLMEGSYSRRLQEGESMRRLRATIQMFINASMCSIFGYEYHFDRAQKVLDWVDTGLHQIELLEFASSTVMFFLQRGWAAYEKRNLKYLFFSDDWIDFEVEFRTVQNEVESIHQGFESSSISMIQLTQRLDKMIDMLHSKIPLARNQYKLTLSDRLKQCLQLRIDLEGLKKKEGVRRAPFSVLLWGNSGVGKSWVSQTLSTSLLTCIGLPCDPFLIRTPNGKDDFDSMLDNNTLCVNYDDLSNGLPDKELKNPLDPILRLVNNVVAPANKADLREKGKVFLTPWVVIGSSNVKNLNVGNYSVEPLSILRRFDATVRVECEAKYMSNGKLDIELWNSENRTAGKPPCTYTVECVSAAAESDVSQSGVNTTYTHHPQKCVYNIVSWVDPCDPTGLSRPLEKVSWEVLERYLKSECIKKTNAQTGYLKTLKKTSSPTTCKHMVSYPYCVECKSKKYILSKFFLFASKRISLYSSSIKWKAGSYTPTLDHKSKGLKTRGIESVIWTRKVNFKNSALLTMDGILGTHTGELFEPLLPYNKYSLLRGTGKSNSLVFTEPIAWNSVTHSYAWVDSEITQRNSVKIHRESRAYVAQLRLNRSQALSRLVMAPSAGDGEAEEKCGSCWTAREERKFTEDWDTLLTWYHNMPTYLADFGGEGLAEAYRARLNIEKLIIARELPMDIMVQPDWIPGVYYDFLIPNPTPRFDEIRRLYKASVEAVSEAQQCRKRLSDSVSEEGDSDDECDFGRFYWFSVFYEWGTSFFLRLPYRFGIWLGTRSKDLESTTFYCGTGFFGGAMFTTLFSVMAIPVLWGSVLAGVLIPASWFTCFVATYIGINHRATMYYIRGFSSSTRMIVNFARGKLFRKHRIVFAALSVLACGIAYYKYTRVPNTSFIASGSAVSTPVPKPNEKTHNYWVANQVKVSDSAGISGYQNTPEELFSTIKTQLVRIRVFPEGVLTMDAIPGSKSIGCCGVTMAGGLLVVPKHIVEHRMGQMIQVLRDDEVSVRNNAAWILSENDVYYPPNTDFAFLYTRHLGAAKDLRKFLPSVFNKEQMRVNFHLLRTDPYGKFMRSQGHAITGYDNVTPVAGVGVYEGYNFEIEGTNSQKLETASGWCMSPFISKTNPSYLHSFYLAGKGFQHRSAPILRTFVDDALEHFSSRGKTMIPSSGTFEPAGGTLVEYPHKRSPINFLSEYEGTHLAFDWFGATDIVGSHRRFSGKVRDTLFAPHMEKVFDCKWKWASPKKLGKWNPWYDNLIAMGAKPSPFDPKLVEIAHQDLEKSMLGFCSNWRGCLGETFQDVIHPLSAKDAINGVPGVSGCDRIKMATSAGYPFNCPKKKVFSEVEDSNYPCGVRLEPDPKVMQMCDNMIAKAKAGERSYVTFRASPKDEPTVLTKEKVRIFAGCPVSYLIAMRMYTGTLVKFMTDNHLGFYTVAGANAHDFDWTLASKYLADYSVNNIICGDYCDYDKKILADLMVRAVEITCSMLRLAGYTAEQILIAQNLMLESCFPLYEWNSDFISVVGSNPSGQPLTVWLNNIVNLLYQRIVFYSFYEPTVVFDDAVRILVLGDDNIMAVKDGFEKYNHTSIQQVLGAHGLAYTMADKSDGSIPYIKLEEATLLKRKMIWSDTYGCYMCPIEEKSIFRCLYSHMLECGPKSEALKDHCVMMSKTALAEWFYFGKDHYNMRLLQVAFLMKEAGLGNHVGELLKYEDQAYAFKVRLLGSRCLFGVQPDFPWLQDFEHKGTPEIVEFLPSAGACAYYGDRVVLFGCGRASVLDRAIDTERCIVLVDGANFCDFYQFRDKYRFTSHRVLGVHGAEHFDPLDPRILESWGTWVLVHHDERLNKIYKDSFGSLVHESSWSR